MSGSLVPALSSTTIKALDALCTSIHFPVHSWRNFVATTEHSAPRMSVFLLPLQEVKLVCPSAATSNVGKCVEHEACHPSWPIRATKSTHAREHVHVRERIDRCTLARAICVYTGLPRGAGAHKNIHFQRCFNFVTATRAMQTFEVAFANWVPVEDRPTDGRRPMCTWSTPLRLY